LYATPPMIRNSTACRFNNAKKSLKSLFTIRPHLLSHPLTDLEALATAEYEPVVEVDLLGNFVGLGDPQDAFHEREAITRGRVARETRYAKRAR
jgi:hypothetical protein